MRRVVYAFIVIAILVFALGFNTYMAFGQAGGNQVTVSVTATPVVGGGGGGGGGGEGEGAVCPAGEVYVTDKTTFQGVVIKTIIVIDSFDNRFRLTVEEGIVALTYAGLRLGCVGIHELKELPPIPEDAYLIGILYDAVPDRATFNPPAILEYSYEPGSIPPEVDIQSLVIATYDEASGQWTALYSIVDTQARTVTAQIGRFNDLAIFGYEAEAPPPAAFQVSSLNISPAEVYPGETVIITIQVSNTGGQSASYQVVLKINGVAETAKEVILAPGASTQVSFATTKVDAGTYSVDINGATGTFEVKPRPVVPTEHFNWWIVGAAIAGAALAALLTHAFRTQKKYGGVTGALSAEMGQVASLGPKLTKALRPLLKKLNKLIKRK